jgi:hypothetical protein
MDIIAAYREVGTFRGAAEITGTTHKTVRRVIARHEAGSAAPARPPRSHNYDGVAELVAARVKATAGRISAKRLLPAARAARYAGSDRNFRRLVAERKRLCTAAVLRYLIMGRSPVRVAERGGGTSGRGPGAGVATGTSAVRGRCCAGPGGTGCTAV